MTGLDLRSIEKINVLDLDQATLESVRQKCSEAGLHVQSIGSPVNKVPLLGSSQALETSKLERAIDAAKATGTSVIRIFTPEVPATEFEPAWTSIEAWMAEQLFMAENAGVTLIHENDAKFYGAYPDNAKRLFDRFGGPNFKAAFDFANTVLIGFRPMKDWFPWLLPHLHTLHIKDAVEATGSVVPAGEGDGDLGATLTWLQREGWSGPLTLEPHLASAGKFGGFSGEQLFETAVNALRRIATDSGVAFP